MGRKFCWIYLCLLLTGGFLLWLEVVVERRLRICLRRINRGVVWEEDLGGGRRGSVVLSSSGELRRRLWFDETHETHVDDIPPRRGRFFVDFVAVAIAIEEDEVNMVVVVLWWFWIDAVERGRDEILGVELFRCEETWVEFRSSDDGWDECFLVPQHRNGKERMVAVVVVEDDETGDCGDLDNETFFSWVFRNGRIVVVGKTSDDDDDRMIEMTDGGGLLVTLVIDFYENDENDDDVDDNDDEEPRIGIHARNDESNVAYCWRATHIRGRVSLSLSYPLFLLLPADDARKGEQWQCSWWPWHPAQQHSKARDKKQNGRTRQTERKKDRLLFLCILLFSHSFSFFPPSFFFFYSLQHMNEVAVLVAEKDVCIHVCVCV